MIVQRKSVDKENCQGKSIEMGKNGACLKNSRKFSVIGAEEGG